jgi:probable F420-dependent oxidoreductase
VSFRVETVILSPGTDQYAGRGQRAWTLDRVAAEAREAEGLGFDGVTTPEAGHDPFLPLAIAAEHTRRVRLGTNVAIAFPRSPMVTAQLAWDLQQLSGGRFRLGLGTQVKAHVERRYAAKWSGPPGPRLREYVRCLRAMFESFAQGRARPFDGEHYRFSLLPPFFSPGPIDHRHPPVDVAAVNPTMGRIAGELCDGLRLHPIATFRFAREVVLPAVAEGAARAGRASDAVDVIGAPFLALGPDAAGVEKARAAMKQHIAFYASTPTYHSVLAHHGWNDAAEALHRLSREGRWTEMPGQISDAMLDAWAVSATYDELVPRLRERCGGLFTTLLLDLPPALRADAERVRAIVAALREEEGS